MVLSLGDEIYGRVFFGRKRLFMKSCWMRRGNILNFGCIDFEMIEGVKLEIDRYIFFIINKIYLRYW